MLETNIKRVFIKQVQVDWKNKNKTRVNQISIIGQQKTTNLNQIWRSRLMITIFIKIKNQTQILEISYTKEPWINIRFKSKIGKRKDKCKLSYKSKNLLFSPK